MAGFNIDPQISLGAKPPQVMSIGDMVNIARGAQAYKQAEQINPLQVQEQRAVTQQQETAAEKATRALEPELARIGAESEKSVLSAQQAHIDLKQHYSNVERSLLGGFVTDPDFINGNAAAMTTKIKGAQDYAIKVLGLPEDIVRASDPLVEMAKTSPREAYQAIRNGVIQSGQNQAQTNLVTPRLENINNVPYSYTPATNEAVVAGTGGQQPASQETPQTQPTVTAADMNKPVHSQPEKLKYPVRQAGQTFAPALGEEVERDVNQKYRLKLVQQQADLVPYKRNVEEVVKKAEDILQGAGPEWTKSGWAGATRRFFSKGFGGTDYTELSKDLANVQLAALKSSGGDLGTDAGKSLVAHANGDETYPPDTLIKIARRTYGDVINTDLQATASQKAAEKFGDNNLGKFRKEWSKNADSKVFEIMALPQLIKDPAQRKKMADEIIGYPVGSKERARFLEKYKNIQKLTQDGSL